MSAVLPVAWDGGNVLCMHKPYLLCTCRIQQSGHASREAIQQKQRLRTPNLPVALEPTKMSFTRCVSGPAVSFAN